MLPETISPKLLDMTHMFIATHAQNPITNHDEVRVETLKFVIKHGHVGVSSEGYATPNITELTKLTDMFSPVHAVTRTRTRTRTRARARARTRTRIRKETPAPRRTAGKTPICHVQQPD